MASRVSCHRIPRSPRHQASALVDYYFRIVCGVYSAFDSALNPFRTSVAELWCTSRSIYYAIQSMAAAHLANRIPSMQAIGLELQCHAYASLRQELSLTSPNQLDDTQLLALLLLGMTTSWHKADDLGLAHLHIARSSIRSRLMLDGVFGPVWPAQTDQFFSEALIYWEMIMSFVVDEPYVSQRDLIVHMAPLDDPRRHAIRTKVVPHPWTGVASREQVLFTEVGRLIRHLCTIRASSPLDENQSSGFNAAARRLEEALLSVSTATPELVVDVEDKKTPSTDFVLLAEATKCAGLLLVYRVFPDLLATRLGSKSRPLLFSQPSFDSPTNTDNGFEMGIKTWLTSMAVHIVDLLASVAIKSGTRPFRLLLLPVAAAELTLGTAMPGESLSVQTYNLEVTRARRTAMRNLEELSSMFPSKPVFRAIDLVKEVWRRNDVGDYVLWVDVMITHGWESIMG